MIVFVCLIVHRPHIVVVAVKRSVACCPHHCFGFSLCGGVELCAVHGSVAVVAGHLLAQLAVEPRCCVDEHAGFQGAGCPIVGPAFGLSLVVGSLKLLDGSVKVGQNLAIDHFFRHADGVEILRFDGCVVVGHSSPDVHHVEIVECPQEVSLAEILLFLALREHGAFAHLHNGIVAYVCRAVEHLPIVVERGVVVHVVVQSGRGESVLVERLLLVVKAITEEVGSHFAQSQSGLLAIPASCEAVAVGHKSVYAGLGAVGEIGRFAHFILLFQKVGTRGGDSHAESQSGHRYIKFCFHDV